MLGSALHVGPWASVEVPPLGPEASARPIEEVVHAEIRVPNPLKPGLVALGLDQPHEAAEVGGMVGIVGVPRLHDGGSRVDASNLMARVLKPAAADAGLGEWVRDGRRLRAESWVGFHTFRHTCATILFRRGWNAVQGERRRWWEESPSGCAFFAQRGGGVLRGPYVNGDFGRDGPENASADFFSRTCCVVQHRRGAPQVLPLPRAVSRFRASRVIVRLVA